MQAGNKSIDDLIKLTEASRLAGAVLILTGLSSWDIAEAGKGSLILEDNPTIPFIADGHQK